MRSKVCDAPVRGAGVVLAAAFHSFAATLLNRYADGAGGSIQAASGAADSFGILARLHVRRGGFDPCQR